MGTVPQPDLRARRDTPAGSAEDRFAALFRRHWGEVHAYARRRSGSDADAHDIASETFTVAWRRFDDLPAGHELPWLYRTAANVLANRARSSRRRLRLVSKIDSQPRPRHEPIDDVIVADAELASAFATLDDDQRELLRLVAWEGLTNEEIGTVLDISSNAVASRVSRARAKFETALATADAASGHERDDRTRRTR